MKVVFVGPSLPDAAALAAAWPDAGIEIRPPARRGDLRRAVEDGARAIGLVDGYFDEVPSVWHKEILLALSRGIPVLGAASLGALRAVECEAYGMRGIGRIFEAYRGGHRVDDGDVALSHGPAELGYPALSVPLVTVDATLAAAQAAGAIDAREAALVALAARAVYFKERSWRRIAEQLDATRIQLMQRILPHAVDPKREDALTLLNELALKRSAFNQGLVDWTLQVLPEPD
ncbi:TfuA-like protein [Rhizobium sp. YIM 134829]|uniref:TfuA-like protein n=1 Tax=Rhizobium sp. YIM 134829 TaxID=3390453 RepID=UPI00397E1482